MNPSRWRLQVFLCAAFLAAWCVCAWAQGAPAYFHHQVWSTEDGLPQVSVHAVLQSHEGYIWVATESGAARFDGQSFRVLNHGSVPAFESDDVSSLAEDGAGDLWFGTADGLIRKHGEQYTRFAERDSLPSSKVLALAAEQNELLVLTASGLAVRRGDRFSVVKTGDQITGLAASPLGLMVAASSGAVYRWSAGQLVAMNSMVGLPGTLAVAAHDEKAVWTFGATFAQVSSGQKRTLHTGMELTGSRVQALYVDRQGTAWIGTNRGLMTVSAAPGGAVQECPELRGESVLSIYEDREGDLWVGTEASGLHVLQPRRFATLPGSGPEAVTTVARSSKGVMYFGTRDSGLFKSAGKPITVAAEKLSSPVVLSLAAGRDDDLWVGTPDGLDHITGDVVKHWTISDGLPDNFVRSVAGSVDGTVWAGTRFGLVHIDGKVQTFTVSDGLRADSIGPLLETRGTLWIGTSAGLCRRDDSRIRCLPPDYGNEASVTALGVGRDGTVWVGSHGQGLAMIGADRVLPVRSAALPTEIVGILADGDGWLWIRGQRGLYRAEVGVLRECAMKPDTCGQLRVDMFGRNDGMPSDDVANEGMVPETEGPGGELWFATRRGIAVTDPEHIAASSLPPGVVMTKVQVDGDDLDSNTPVQPRHRQFSFEYIGLSFNNAGRIHYRYMLEGFDRGWIDAGARRTAYYTNLPPRSYVFHVMAANGDGLWSTSEAAFRFDVQKPWYRSWWTYLGAVCVAALIVLGFVQLRVRAERRRFALVLQERNRVAREVHDTLAQDLVSVSLQVDLATQFAKTGKLKETTDQLVQTKSLVRQALDSARQSIWNLRANLPDESLPVRLATRVRSFRDSSVAARLRISGEYRSADPAVENEVMRIASEAISNVERHAGATEMHVELSYAAESLRLQIRDNGRGFDYASARSLTGHYGLQGLEERAAVLNGELSVESVPGHGTTVTLIAPLPVERT